MDTIKKSFISFIVFALMISLGCTHMNTENNAQSFHNEQNSKHEKQEDEKTNIEIAIWSLGYQKGLENAIATFNKKNNDNIEINLLQIPKFKYTEILNMLMTSGDGPDIFGINSEWLDTYINREWTLDISEYLDDNFLKDFPDWAVMFAKHPAFRGRFYTIPASMITSRLIYNKDLFEMAGLDPEKPPITLEELEKYALQISNVGIGIRKYGFAVPLGEEWAGFVQSMEMPCTYSGVYYYDFKKGSYDVSQYRKWLQTIANLKNKGGLYPGENTIKLDILRAQFAEGNIGMMFASSWDPAVLQKQYSMKCKWGVTMPPAIDHSLIGKGKSIVLPGVCYVVNPNSSDKEKVIKVWKYLYSKDSLGEQYRQGGEIPVLNGIISDPEFQPNIENYAEFLPGVNDSPYPNTPIGVNEWERFATYMEAFKNSESAAKALEYQNAKLNETFMNKVFMNIMDIHDYRNSNFNALKPLE